MRKRLVFISVFFILAQLLKAQPVLFQREDSSGSANQAAQVPQQYLDKVSAKSQKLEQALDKKSQKALAQLQKLETKIKKRLLVKTDSLTVDKVFANAGEKYKELEEKLKNGKLTGQYIAKLDTILTSIKFLGEHKEFISQAKEVQEKLKESLAKINGLQNQLAKAEEIKKFLRERKEFLQAQFSKFGFTKQLKKINKQLYYYAQTISELKNTLNSPDKIERKTLELLSKTKMWQNFMQKNSILASLFRMPGDESPPLGGGGAFAGLQTRTSVNNLIQQQISAGGPNAQQQFQSNLQQAQSQINELKNKIAKFGGGSSDDEMPEGFRPNPARSKTFLQRFTLGTDFQSTRHNNLFPAGSDVGVSLSYMLNANSHLSAGSSIKIGWGTGFNNIRISSQGVSFRGGLDWRLRGNLFIAGNYEQNYFSEIRNIAQLRNYSGWKTAALFGLSKKIITKKNKGGQISLLYDVFYDRPPVRTQAVVFRAGYNF